MAELEGERRDVHGRAWRKLRMPMSNKELALQRRLRKLGLSFERYPLLDHPYVALDDIGVVAATQTHDAMRAVVGALEGLTTRERDQTFRALHKIHRESPCNRHLKSKDPSPSPKHA